MLELLSTSRTSPAELVQPFSENCSSKCLFKVQTAGLGGRKGFLYSKKAVEHNSLFLSHVVEYTLDELLLSSLSKSLKVILHVILAPFKWAWIHFSPLL